MSFTLPTFGVDYLEFFFFCARLGNPGPELVSWVGDLDESFVETSYETDNGTVWIMAIAELADKDESDPDNGGDDSTYIHFHVNCALNSYFKGSRDEKEPPHTREEFQEFCRRFVGKQLASVRVVSRFVVPETDLPKLSVANLLGTKATVGGKKVIVDRLGAGFVDSPHRHERIEWAKQKKNGNVIIRLVDTDSDVVVADGYLEEIQESLSQTLDQFILEKEGNVDA